LVKIEDGPVLHETPLVDGSGAGKCRLQNAKGHLDIARQGTRNTWGSEQVLANEDDLAFMVGGIPISEA
jgi:hypothetical protein